MFPFFVTKMNRKELENAINDWLPEGYFLVELSVKGGDNISIYIDSYNGISVSDCQSLSRHITKIFDRDQEDYTLQVSSAGLDKPFRVEEQYIKNVGRKVKVVKDDDDTLEGELKSIADGVITIEKEATSKNKRAKEIEIITIRLEEIKSTKLCF